MTGGRIAVVSLLVHAVDVRVLERVGAAHVRPPRIRIRVVAPVGSIVENPDGDLVGDLSRDQVRTQKLALPECGMGANSFWNQLPKSTPNRVSAPRPSWWFRHLRTIS